MLERFIPSIVRALAALPIAVPLAAAAGDFAVAPTRIDLDKATRASVVEVSSDDARKLSFQVKLFAWTQDAQGLDQYAESQDLIWFPQIFTLEPKAKRIIRVGTKPGVPVPEREQAYRLFIEELPQPSEPSAGAELKVVLRFGLPVFVAPASPRRSIVAEAVGIAPGKVSMRLRNDATQSVRFETVSVRRNETVVAEAAGWYVLAGATRALDVAIDPARCPLAGSFEAQAVAEGLIVKQAFDATPVVCQRP